MENLSFVIEKLEIKRDLLLKQKEVNLKLIEECECKIRHYKNLYNYYVSLYNVKESQKNEYLNILEYADEPSSLFDCFYSRHKDMIQKSIAQVNSEISSIKDTKKVCVYLYNYYCSKKSDLEIKNSMIDEKVSQMDEKMLDQEEGKKKVFYIERGRK